MAPGVTQTNSSSVAQTSSQNAGIAVPVGDHQTSTSPVINSSNSTSSGPTNIFGRLKKVVSVKTKFSSSPPNHTKPATTSDGKPKILRTKAVKESKVPVSLPLNIQTTNLSSGTVASAPVITGAVTKSPVSVSHCSPSKQLLNSFFSVSSVPADSSTVLNNQKTAKDEATALQDEQFLSRGGRLRRSLSHESLLGNKRATPTNNKTEVSTADCDGGTVENTVIVGDDTTIRGRNGAVPRSGVTQHNGKLCQPVGAIRRLTSDTNTDSSLVKPSLSTVAAAPATTASATVTATVAPVTTVTAPSQVIHGTATVTTPPNSNIVVGDNLNTHCSGVIQTAPSSAQTCPLNCSCAGNTYPSSDDTHISKINNNNINLGHANVLNNFVNNLNSNNCHNNHHNNDVDKLLYKPKMRRSISKDSIDDKSYWSSMNETQQLQDYLKNTSSMLKNLNMMSQVRGANFKNAQNHQFNNFHQYILQLQREKQDLQSQLIELVQNADLKRHEIEKLQKDLKQVKEKYYLHKQQVEAEILENKAKNKDEPAGSDSVDFDDNHQAGPSGFCPSGYEWDKQSSSSISELSVANLQDRINQMEETHYSTSEELQATVQELEDLRDQVTQLESSNEQLELDKNFLLGTLCEQTKKLENCLLKIDRMQKLLFSQYPSTSADDTEDSSRPKNTSLEREQNLIELLKTVEQEKNDITQKRNELIVEYEDLKAKFDQERMELFEAKLKNIEQFQRMNSEKDDDDVVPEMFVFSRPLHSATSLPDFQHPQGQSSTSFHSLDDLDRNTESDFVAMTERLQFINRQLQDQIAMKDVEIKKLKEANILMESSHKDALNKSEQMIKNLENRNKEILQQNEELNHQLKSTQEAKMESEIRAQKNFDEKLEIRILLEEKDKRIEDLETKYQAKCREFAELGDKLTQERNEWNFHQNDLLTAVRVSNEFKQEMLVEHKKLQVELAQTKERLIATENEVQRIKGENEKLQVALRSAAVAAAVSNETNSSNSSTSSSSKQYPLSVGNSDMNSVTNSPTKPSLLIQKLKDFDGVPEAVTPVNTPTSPRLTYSITPRNKISVRSLVESIESKKTSGSTSPTQSVSPICLRSNSVPVGTGDLINRIRPIDSQISQSSSPASKPTNSTSNSVAIVAPTILKEPPKSVETKPSAIRADILSSKIRSALSEFADKKDPLSALVRGGGSKRNALLKWCKNKTTDYPGIDITNFSSSWNDGLAFCAILHTYLKDKIPYETLSAEDKQRNFSIAFKAAESVGIPTTLDLNELISQERPDWHKIMAYVTSIYTHFEA